MEQSVQNCQNCKTDFTIEPEDFDFYAKIDVTPPTICSECRVKRRMIFRNFKTLYKRPSSFSGESLISMYDSDTTFPVVSSKEWWSDSWDPMSYGLNLDLNKSFKEQFKELLNTVPRFALMNTKSTDCEYSNMTYESSRCYLVFGCVSDEECDYGHIVWNSKNTIDSLYAFKCEYSYECVDCLNSNQLFYSQECESCADSIGLFDCRSCTDCIGCVGLRGKSYYIFNQPVSKEAYKEFLEKNPLSNRETISLIQKKVEELRNEIPVPEYFGSHNVDVSGNHIYHAKDVKNSFDIKSGENSKFGYTVRKIINSYDVNFTADVEESYEVLNCMGSNIRFSHLVVDSSFVDYSDTCYGSQNLFGCVGLRQKSYCILNKEYSKEEYEKLVPKIIEGMKERGEWGEFFSHDLSSFAYNESIVNEYYPLSKEEIISKGFKFKEEALGTKGLGTITIDKVPNNPDDYTNDLLKEIFTCESCDKNYRLIERELIFYKRFGLSIPRSCFNCRHMRRMKQRDKREIFDTNCANCSKEIKTSSKGKMVYCISCYQNEIL